MLTYCAEFILANTRAHQLRWDNLEMETAISRVCVCVCVCVCEGTTVPRPSLCPAFDYLWFLTVKVVSKTQK